MEHVFEKVNIYFDKPPKTESLEELFEQLFTVTRDGYFRVSLFTYYDAEMTQQQCHPARRSFYDLVNIGLTYFPESSIEDIATAIYNMNNFYSFVCPDINKLVFMKGFADNEFYEIGSRSTDYVGADGMSFNIFKSLVKQKK